MQQHYHAIHGATHHGLGDGQRWKPGQRAPASGQTRDAEHCANVPAHCCGHCRAQAFLLGGNKIHKVLSKIAFPALIFLATVFFIQNREAIVDKFAQLGLSITVLILLAMTAGVLMAWLMRLNTRERRTIVIEIGMQNAAQAIAIASSPLVFNNDLIAIPAIIYALMMNIILIIYVAVVKNR